MTSLQKVARQSREGRLLKPDGDVRIREMTIINRIPLMPFIFCLWVYMNPEAKIL